MLTLIKCFLCIYWMFMFFLLILLKCFSFSIWLMCYPSYVLLSLTCMEKHTPFYSYRTLLWPDVWGFFPHPAVLRFSREHLVACNVRQLWLYLEMASDPPYEFRALSHKSAPYTHFRCHLQIQVVTCASWFLAFPFDSWSFHLSACITPSVLAYCLLSPLEPLAYES